MTSPAVIRALQERAARGQPAALVEDRDGWWLRHAPGCAWWVGTVLPHGDVDSGDVLRRVVDAEDFYTHRHAVARFQITPGACAEAVDDVLAQRGYARTGATCLLTASTAEVRAQTLGGPHQVRVDTRPSAAWLDVWQAVHGRGGDAGAEWGLLNRVEQPCAFAAAFAGDDLVAVARATADTGWSGVFGMATLPAARRGGAALALLVALADWAGGHDAGAMYLQVVRDNRAARRLYEAAGFGEACVYHYRTPG